MGDGTLEQNQSATEESEAEWMEMADQGLELGVLAEEVEWTRSSTSGGSLARSSRGWSRSSLASRSGRGGLTRGGHRLRGGDGHTLKGFRRVRKEGDKRILLQRRWHGKFAKTDRRQVFDGTVGVEVASAKREDNLVSREAHVAEHGNGSFRLLFGDEHLLLEDISVVGSRRSRRSLDGGSLGGSRSGNRGRLNRSGWPRRGGGLPEQDQKKIKRGAHFFFSGAAGGLTAATAGAGVAGAAGVGAAAGVAEAAG